MHIKLERLEKYINGEIDGEEKAEIEEHLRECLECWESSLSLRELNFFEDMGTEATSDEKRKILATVTKPKKKKIPLARILIQFLENGRVLMSSSGQDSLDNQMVSYDFQTRSGSKAGGLSITRHFGDYRVDVILTPTESDKDFQLALDINKDEKISVDLFSGSERLETILDLRKQKTFTSLIKKTSDLELIFKKGKEELFQINIHLKQQKS